MPLASWREPASADDLQQPRRHRPRMTSCCSAGLSGRASTRCPAALPFASWLVHRRSTRHYAWYGQSEPAAKTPTDSDAAGFRGQRDASCRHDGIDGLRQRERGALGPRGAGPDQGRCRPDIDPNNDNCGVLLPDGSCTNPGGTEGDRIFPGGRAAGRRRPAPAVHAAHRSRRSALPMRWSFYPEVGWHETLYQSDAQAFESAGPADGPVWIYARGCAAASATSPICWSRAWAGPTSTTPPSPRTTRSMCRATAVPQRRVRELDLENVTRDPADRIDGIPRGHAGPGQPLLRGPLGVAGGWCAAAGRLRALGPLRHRGGGVREHLPRRARLPLPGRDGALQRGLRSRGQARIDEGLAAIHWWDDRGDRVNLGYRYLRDIPRASSRPSRSRTTASTTTATGVEQHPSDRRRGADRHHPAVGHHLPGGVQLRTEPPARQPGGHRVPLEVPLLGGAAGGQREPLARGSVQAVLYTLVGIGDDSRSPFETLGATRLPRLA